jgi:hypothetical protein
MSITLIEDLLAPNQFNYVAQRFTDVAIDWFYLPFTANLDDVEGEDPKYQGSFSHLIYKDNQAISPLWDPSLHILLAALDHKGQELDSVLRVRLGLCTRTPWAVEHSPHIDHPVLDHCTGIFYPTTSDGDTVVFDQRQEQARREMYTVWHRQRPVANTWMDFPGRHFHASTTPVAHETRLVLTINYTVKSDKKR